MCSDAADEIRRLNDLLRKTGGDGIVLFDRAIFARGEPFYQAVSKAVMDCNDFGPDLFRHHDFGKAIVEGSHIRWWIEYRSTHLFEERSSNPADPRQTIRVLHIRLIRVGEDDDQ